MLKGLGGSYASGGGGAEGAGSPLPPPDPPLCSNGSLLAWVQAGTPPKRTESRATQGSHLPPHHISQGGGPGEIGGPRAPPPSHSHILGGQVLPLHHPAVQRGGFGHAGELRGGHLEVHGGGCDGCPRGGPSCPPPSTTGGAASTVLLLLLLARFSLSLLPFSSSRLFFSPLRSPPAPEQRRARASEPERAGTRRWASLGGLASCPPAHRHQAGSHGQLTLGVVPLCVPQRGESHRPSPHPGPVLAMGKLRHRTIKERWALGGVWGGNF